MARPLLSASNLLPAGLMGLVGAALFLTRGASTPTGEEVPTGGGVPPSAEIEAAVARRLDAISRINAATVRAHQKEALAHAQRLKDEGYPDLADRVLAALKPQLDRWLPANERLANAQQAVDRATALETEIQRVGNFVTGPAWDSLSVTIAELRALGRADVADRLAVLQRRKPVADLTPEELEFTLSEIRLQPLPPPPAHFTIRGFSPAYLRALVQRLDAEGIPSEAVTQYMQLAFPLCTALRAVGGASTAEVRVRCPPGVPAGTRVQ